MPDESESIDEDPDPEEYNIKISNKIDVWAFGLIINEMFAGEKPWHKRFSKNLAPQIKALQVQQLLIQRADFEPSFTLTEEVREMIFACTKTNPKQRPSMKQLKNHLMKKFYLKVKDIEDLISYFNRETPKISHYLINKVRGYINLFHIKVSQLKNGKISS